MLWCTLQHLDRAATCCLDSKQLVLVCITHIGCEVTKHIVIRYADDGRLPLVQSTANCVLAAACLAEVVLQWLQWSWQLVSCTNS